MDLPSRGRSEWGLGSWLWLGRTRAVAGVWGVSHRMGIHSLINQIISVFVIHLCYGILFGNLIDRGRMMDCGYVEKNYTGL